MKGETEEEKKNAGRRKYDADLAAKVLEDGPDLVVCVSLVSITPEVAEDRQAERRNDG